MINTRHWTERYFPTWAWNKDVHWSFGLVRLSPLRSHIAPFSTAGWREKVQHPVLPVLVNKHHDTCKKHTKCVNIKWHTDNAMAKSSSSQPTWWVKSELFQPEPDVIILLETRKLRRNQRNMITPRRGVNQFTCRRSFHQNGRAWSARHLSCKTRTTSTRDTPWHFSCKIRTTLTRGNLDIVCWVLIKHGSP